MQPLKGIPRSACKISLPGLTGSRSDPPLAQNMDKQARRRGVAACNLAVLGFQQWRTRKLRADHGRGDGGGGGMFSASLTPTQSHAPDWHQSKDGIKIVNPRMNMLCASAPCQRTQAATSTTTPYEKTHHSCPSRGECMHSWGGGLFRDNISGMAHSFAHA